MIYTNSDRPIVSALREDVMLLLNKSLKMMGASRDGGINFAFYIEENITLRICTVEKLEEFFKRGYASAGISELTGY